MKALMAMFLTVCLMAVSISVPLGCSTNQSKVAYVSSGATHISARAALSGWNDYLGREYAAIAEQAKTDPEKAAKRKAELTAREVTVKAAYERYQASQLAVLTAAQAFSRVRAGNTNAPAAQDRLTEAVAASSVTLASVLDVLREFGVQIK